MGSRQSLFLSRPHDTNPTIISNRHVEVHLVAISEDDIVEPTSTAQQLLNKELSPLRRKCHSTSAITRRNRKRNMTHRLRRDQHIITRNVYHRFNVSQIKNIFGVRDVRYVHLKLDTSTGALSIGMKKPCLVTLYFDRIPDDLFDREHYQQYRLIAH